MQVNIYIECDSSPKESEKRYGYVLQCFTKKGEQTREGFGKKIGTCHNATLYAIIKALERMTKQSEIHIYTQNTFVANMFTHYLADWAENGFKNSRNEPISNAAEWKQIWEACGKHEISITSGKHPFSNWILEEVKRRQL